MTRTFTASVLALSIALTSLAAAPAYAGKRDDINRAIFGVVTLFILSKAIEGNKARGNVSRSQQNPVNSQNNNRRNNFKRLPEDCYFTMRTRNGTRGVYGKTCLTELMRHADRLPTECKERVKVRNGRRADIYRASCLREYGYRDTARR